MSRTSILVTNNSSLPLSISSVDGQVAAEEDAGSVNPGDQRIPLATIGDPGHLEHVTTGGLWLQNDDVVMYFSIRRPKHEDCRVDTDLTNTYGWTVTYSNDYADPKSQFYRSLTITVD